MHCPKTLELNAPIRQLPFKGKHLRPMPHCLSRSALFGVNRARKETFISRQIPASRGISISYTGPSLHQGHADVYLEVVFLSRSFALGEKVEFRHAELLRFLGRSLDGGSLRTLKWQLDELVEATVKTDEFAASLLHKVHHKSGFLILDIDVWKLFAPTEVSWQYIAMRKALRRDIDKWYLSFYSSHKATSHGPQRNHLEDLRELCGSQASQKKFREMTIEAMKNLETLSFIERFGFTKNGALEVVKKKR